MEAVKIAVILNGVKTSQQIEHTRIADFKWAEAVRSIGRTVHQTASAREKLEVLRLRSRPPAPAGNSAQDDGWRMARYARRRVFAWARAEAVWPPSMRAISSMRALPSTFWSCETVRSWA
jgi:hypothetical protein